MVIYLYIYMVIYLVIFLDCCWGSNPVPQQASLVAATHAAPHGGMSQIDVDFPGTRLDETITELVAERDIFRDRRVAEQNN